MKKLALFFTFLFIFFPLKVFASCEDITSNALSESSIVVNYINYGGSSGSVSSQSGGVLTPTNIESITQLTKTISTTFTDDYLIMFGNLEFLVYGNDPGQNPNTPVVTNISSPMLYYEYPNGTLNYSFCEYLPSVNSGITDYGYIAEYGVTNLLTPQLSSFDFTLKCHRGPNFPDTRATYRLVFTFYYNSFSANSFTLNSQYRINSTFRNRSLSVKNTCTNEQIIESLDSINDSIIDINDTITDTNVSGASSNFEDVLDNWSYNDFSLSDFVTAPLNFIRSLANQNVCSPITLPPLLGNTSTFQLPCIMETFATKFPSLFTIYQIAIYFFVCYRIGIDLFRTVHKLKDPLNDEISVADI